MIKIANGLIDILVEEIEDGMDETGEVDSGGEELEGNHLVKSLSIFRILLHPERRTSIGMNHKHIEVLVDVLVTLIVIVMITPRARVIEHHLMNELDETDAIPITLDLPLLCLMLTPVRHLRLFNLVLNKIHLFHRGIRRILNLELT